MVLIAHIVIALFSLVYATYALLKPSDSRFKVIYSLVGLTVASGTYLVAMQPGHMVQACVSGLFYLSAIAFITVLAKLKLAAQEKSTK
jgi:hypothetical protein